MVQTKEVFSSILIWGCLISAFIIIFIIVFVILVNIRKRQLKLFEESVMESNLKVDKNELGKQYDEIAEIWNRRADIYPKPSHQHIAKGWNFDEKNNEQSIRQYMSKSIDKITSAALSKNEKYRKKPSMTAEAFLNWLSEQDGIKIDEELIRNFVSYYNSARYGPLNYFFSNDDYEIFNSYLKDIIKAITE